jgi:hypothetical protein
VNHAGSGGGSHECTKGGRKVPCSDPALGWFSATSGCYFKALAKAPPAGTPVEPPAHSGSGGYYVRTCGLGGARFMGVSMDQGVVWLASPPAGGGPALPSPAQLAARAVRRLALGAPRIRTSPPVSSAQLLALPTWLWLAGGSWSSRSATAAVPAESVTATARPTRVVWSMGDGGSVVCDGPGTPYTAAPDPHAASPDCGYTYTEPSSTVGGRYPVTATLSWSVDWAGGGSTGRLVEQRTASTELNVMEAEAINR